MTDPMSDERLAELERRHINRSALDDDSFEVLAAIDEIRKLRGVVDHMADRLNEATEEHDQCAQFLEDLDRALELPEGDEARYSNPEGSAESIYLDVVTAYRTQLEQFRDLATQWASRNCLGGFRVTNTDRDDADCLHCASYDVKVILDEPQKETVP